MPSFLHFAIMLTKPPCFGAQIQILVAYPQDTSIIDMVKREIDMEKSRPLFPHLSLYILSIAHCVQPNPPVLAHKRAFTRKKVAPFFP